MVSIMDEALELEVGHKVLEVGSGSGWHASTLAELVAPSNTLKENWGHVYTVERIAELATFAKNNYGKELDFGFRAVHLTTQAAKE